MATYYFHEETLSQDDGKMRLVRYYYDDISTEVLTRSFVLSRKTGEKEFLDNDRIPLADLRADVKAVLHHVLCQRLLQEMRRAS